MEKRRSVQATIQREDGGPYDFVDDRNTVGRMRHRVRSRPFGRSERGLAVLITMELQHLQELMSEIYGERDLSRGIPATVAWLAEEVGELARAARKGTREEQLHELSDALAWLASLANQLGLSLEDAMDRYVNGCPKCAAIPCRCGDHQGTVSAP